jgi:hypothetical protein
MRALMIGLLIAFPCISLAQTLIVQAGEVYQGIEEINEHRTGRSCRVHVKEISPSSRGLHCFNVVLSLKHQGLAIKDELSLTSRVTNAHRAEYPLVKTCAKTLNGETWSDEIYSSDTTNLVTDIFSGMYQERRVRFDYFLSLDSELKTPSRTRVHVMKSLSEKNVDCVDLELARN